MGIRPKRVRESACAWRPAAICRSNSERRSHENQSMDLVGGCAGCTVLTGCGGGDYGGGTSPAGDTGSAVIGSVGGTEVTRSGSARAVFPANAVNADTAVTIAANSQVPASSRMVAGTAYEFSPSGPLAQPASVTLRYDPPIYRAARCKVDWCFTSGRCRLGCRAQQQSTRSYQHRDRTPEQFLVIQRFRRQSI